MCQFEQHYVVGVPARIADSPIFRADEAFTDCNADSEAVRLWAAMLTDYNSEFNSARVLNVPEQSSGDGDNYDDDDNNNNKKYVLWNMVSAP